MKVALTLPTRHMTITRIPASMQHCRSTMSQFAIAGHAGGKYTLLRSGPAPWSAPIAPVTVP